MPDEWMQSVAMEMNLAETAFIQRQGDGYGLRWFTPEVEVPLCGHATLASAHILWEAGLHSPSEPIRSHTKSGILTCRRSERDIEMDFPACPVDETEPPPELLAALGGVTATFVGRTSYSYLVVVENAEAVRNLRPDFRALKEIPTTAFVVTSRADDPRFDFISRFFAPAVGIDEDPVTGSAHCCLAPFWAEILGKDSMTAFQASARGGVVQMRVAGDRVFLGGQAVTVWRGELLAVP